MAFVYPETLSSYQPLPVTYNRQGYNQAGVNHWKVQLAVKPVPDGEPPKAMGLEGGAE
jgi:hypothetical protein